VPAERLLLRAEDILSKKRNRYVDSSARAILLVKNWLGQSEVGLWEVVEVEEEEEQEVGKDWVNARYPGRSR